VFVKRIDSNVGEAHLAEELIDLGGHRVSEHDGFLAGFSGRVAGKTQTEKKNEEEEEKR